MTCSQCGHSFDPVVIVQGLTVCQNPSCVRTLVAGNDGIGRVASSSDLTGVAAVELDQLRKSRPKVWREATKARITEIRGR